MSPVAAPEAAAKPARLSLVERAERAAVGMPSAALGRVLPEGKRPVDVAAFSSSI